jgi:cation diffusion facilitator CzcD-associated flavoprotein CzcO
MTRFAKEHDVEKFAVLNTKVLSCEWANGKWMVTLERKDGSTFSDSCDVLVNGTGIINKWKWPAIEGLEDFQGLLAHSANWPRDLCVPLNLP